jgi:hypothetical protein
MNEIKLSSSVLLRGLNFPCWKAFYSQFTKIYLTVFICISIPIYLSIFLAPQNGLFRFWCCLFLSRQQKRKTDLWGGTGNEAGPSAGALSRLSFVLFVCLFCLFVCLFCLFCLFALNLFFFTFNISISNCFLQIVIILVLFVFSFCWRVYSSFNQLIYCTLITVFLNS